MYPIAFVDTHVGLRPKNEDWYRIAPEIGLFAVADGMGGYRGGELASRIAVSALDRFYRDHRETTGSSTALLSMDKAFRLANDEVRRRRQGTLAKMGSTLSALTIQRDHIVIGHIGDSRIYRLRGDRLQQLTSDHSLVSALRDAGVSDMVIHSRFGHVLTRAIGVEGEMTPDISVEAIEPGDLFLLCTDGLSDVLDDESIEQILRELPPSEATTALVEEALRRGGEDNITALLVKMRRQIAFDREAAVIAR